MTMKVLFNLLFLFITYSFIGWVLEAITIIIKEQRFVNRGVLNGPLCTIYGLAIIILTIVTNNINNLFFIFTASVIYPTILEFLAGKILEKVNKQKWWDYSKHKYNIDGYVCLRYSLIWGVLGLISIKFISPLLLNLFHLVPILIRNGILIIILVIILIDFISSFITLKVVKDNALENISNRLGNWILNRIKKAYPNVKKPSKKKKIDNKVFASGGSFYKLFCMFLVGGILGDIVEIFFCRYSMGRWMSRSSLVFGQISLVWGIALALATLLLYRYRNKDNTYLFIFGTIVGGAYEYVCSVFTEYFFGTVFWSYANIPFNLNGRINLLFCFFWGFSTVIYIKKIYPFISKYIEAIPKRIGVVICNILIVFIILDILLTAAIFIRYNERINDISANNKISELLDEYAPDDFIKHRWPNIKIVK